MTDKCPSHADGVHRFDHVGHCHGDGCSEYDASHNLELPKAIPTNEMTSEQAKLHFCYQVVRSIADKGRAHTGDDYPNLVLVCGTLRGLMNLPSLVPPKTLPVVSAAANSIGAIAPDRTRIILWGPGHEVIKPTYENYVAHWQAGWDYLHTVRPTLRKFHE